MEKIKIILDTDMGSDCDDAGALAVLHHLADKGKAEIIGVTHCGSEQCGAVSLKAINTLYKRPNIPIGKYEKSKFLEREDFKRYIKPVAEEYLRYNPMPEIENATKLHRKLLSENRDVVFVVIGALNNISELLKSPPDEISPLSGKELVEKSVKEMYVMGGNFADFDYVEWNIKLDVEGARYVAENFPKQITYCGFEIGEKVLTGAKLSKLPDGNIIKFAYSVQPGCKNCIRSSWDPITVYCAVEQDTPFYKKRENLKISFDENGKVVLEEGGKDCYLISAAVDSDVKKVIDDLLY